MVSTLKKKAESTTDANSLFLIHGDDDFLVAQEARRIMGALIPQGNSEFGLETIEGLASNQGEAAAIFGRLFESLQSQSFFATEKVVWWRSTNLLGANATASAAAVTDFLSTLNQLLQQGLPSGVCLVITATELDGRKAIAKTLSKVGKVIAFKTDPYKQEETRAQALEFAKQTAAELGKELHGEAGWLLVEMSGGDSRTIRSELEKVSAYLGAEPRIRESDVREIGSWRPGGIVWDLPDAIGERNAAKALNVLNDLLFLGEAPVALIFAVISRVRLLLLLSVLVEKKLLRAGGDYSSFKSQMERLPSWVAENLPQDKKLNPLSSHPFMLFKAAGGTARYTRKELERALENLLECNEKLVSSGGDSRHLLEECLLKICMKP